MARTNKSRYSILGMLSYKPMSVYEIKKEIKQSIKFFWSESDGQLYPTIKQLLAQGLIESIETEQVNQRSKAVYKLTPAGKHALLLWLEETPEPCQPRNELLFKTFFGAMLSQEKQLAHIEAELLTNQHRLLVYEKIQKSLDLSDDDPVDVAHWRLTVQYGVFITQAKIDWCEHAKQTITQLNEIST